MKYKLNNLKSMEEKRQLLRRAATPQEVVLWSRLRAKRLGYKFRRQHSFGKFIVDFYCPAKRLVVEIDGSQHADHVKYDEERTEFLQAFGLYVLRFWNNEINTNIEGVLLMIEHALQSPPPTPPRRGGEETD